MRSPFRRRRWLRLPVPLTIALISATAVGALTAANSVAASRADQREQVITLNDLKPDACNGISVTVLVTGTGNFNGSNSAELMIGDAGANRIQGQNGNDCILGGGGNDELRGGNGTDICIGGPGNDSFAQCETTIQ